MILPWSQLGSSQKRTSSHPALKANVLRRTGVQYWDAATLSKHVRKIDYNEFMQGGTSFWDVVVDICRLGIVYLKNVPRDESSVVSITTRIANIRETFYGRTFDVRAKPNAENVAYTSGYLGLHQDLCYLEPPPMIQVLHCMDNSCSGGESLFSDGERAGRLLWPFVQQPGKMAALAEHRVPYQYDKHGHFYHADRAVIDTDADGFAGVYWSPPFQGGYTDGNAVGSAAKDITDWIAAAKVFEGLVNDDDAVHSYKMEPGECVLFDNLRTMHGRNAFDAGKGGSRWLRGAYIAKEDFLSRAVYIPEGQAEMYRGSEEWSGETAEAQLKASEWWPDVVGRVKQVDGRVDM
jgi:alpha-ketoglutarate-dependent taurine dioxygenase